MFCSSFVCSPLLVAVIDAGSSLTEPARSILELDSESISYKKIRLAASEFVSKPISLLLINGGYYLNLGEIELTDLNTAEELPSFEIDYFEDNRLLLSIKPNLLVSNLIMYFRLSMS